MQNKKIKQILSVSLSVLVSAMLVSGAVMAATTIGTSITTAGSLSVGTTSTLTGATTVTGALYGDGGVDRTTAAALALGAANANAVNISKTLIITTVKGLLNVDEAVTFDSTLGVTGTSVLTGLLTANAGLESAVTRATGATGSFQNLAGDLTYEGAAGGTNSYHAGVMGNFLGDTLTNTNATIHAGTIGKYSVTTSDALVGPKAGLVGEAQTSVANAAIMAVLGGDGGAITPGAAYGVRYLNSTPGAGFTYGLDLYSVAVGGYLAVSYGTADLRLQNGATIINGADGGVEIGDTSSVTAAGTAGLNIWIDQADATALTGTLRGAYIQAVNGDANATGAVRGIEVKAKGSTGGGTLTTLEGISLSSDPKNKNVTTQRGAEFILDGAAGSTATLAQGLLITNNSSGAQTASYALDVNSGTASGHKAFTADIRLQNGETISNATDGRIDFGAANLKTTGNLNIHAVLDAEDGGRNSALIVHSHDMVNGVDTANTFKGESLSTSGGTTGIVAEYTMSESGTASITSIMGNAYLLGGKTSTAGNIIGLSGGVSVSGTVNGSGITIAGVVGGLMESQAGTITEVKDMTALWGSSNLWEGQTPGTGDLELLLLSTGLGETIDQAIKIDGSDGANRITNFVKFSNTGTAEGSMAAAESSNHYTIADVGTADGLIKIVIGTTSYWIPVYDAASLTNE